MANKYGNGGGTGGRYFQEDPRVYRFPFAGGNLSALRGGLILPRLIL